MLRPIQPPLQRFRIHPEERVRTIKRDNPVELIRFSDGCEYVVKLQAQPPGSPQKLYRDYVSGTLAQLLELPVPPHGVAYIPQSWVEQHLHPHNPQCYWGHQFLSLFIPRVAPLDKGWPAGWLNVTNPDVFVHLLVFDLWVGNQDRKRTHVLLQATGEPGSLRDVYLIDHGGTLRSRTKMIYRMIHKRSYREVYKHSVALIRRGKAWSPFVRRIQSLSDGILDDVFASIPNDWNISDAEKARQLAFLKHGRDTLADWVNTALEEWAGSVAPRKMPFRLGRHSP